MNKKNTLKFVCQTLCILVVSSLTITTILQSYFPVLQLPQPTGITGIGFYSMYLIDHNRQETFSHNSPRELMIHWWYPIDAKNKGLPMPYALSFDLKNDFIKKLLKWIDNQIRLN